MAAFPTDGGRIVVTDGDGVSTSVWADGTHSRAEGTFPPMAKADSWHASGTKLIYTDGGAQAFVALDNGVPFNVNAAGATKNEPTSRPVAGAALAPDGDRAALATDEGVVIVGGGAPDTVYQAPAGRIAWSAQSNAGTLVWDGFAVQADPGNGIPGGFSVGNGGGIWMSVEGAPAIEVVTDNTATDPSISQDGKLIAWAQDGPTGGTDIYYLDPTEQNPAPHLLAGSTSGNDNMPAVSPDGTRIAFVAGDQPNQTLKIANLDGAPGNNAKTLTNGITGVAWQPVTKATAGTVAVSGTVDVGQTLTATGTASTGTAPLTDSYVWQRCPVSGQDPCVQVGTGLTYTVVNADRGSRLQVVKTAENAARAAVVTSAQTTTVPGAGPTASVVPAAPAAPRQGTALTADTGTWSGTGNTYAYVYQRCATTSTATCADITGATTATYTPTSADVGTYLRVLVTATNAGGSATEASALSAAVLQAVPVSSVAPAAPVAPQHGVQLTGDPGTWSGTGNVHGYQYQRCSTASPASCTDIAGATSRTYTPGVDDIGNRLRVVVTTTNSGGTNTAPSALSTPVLQPAPSVLLAPSLSGSYQEGVTSSAAEHGTWSGAGNTYTYAYQRCAALDPASCVDIPGANALDFTPTAADVGAYVRLVVTATNDGGATTRATAVVGPVKAADKPEPTPPVPPVAPVPPVTSDPVAPVTAPPVPPAPVTQAPTADVAPKSVVSVTTVTRANPSASASAKRADIGCKVDGERIQRCETTLFAIVKGKRVVVGRGVTTIDESGTDRRVTVTNKLTAAGRELVNRPGGIKIQVQAKIRVAGSDKTVTGTGKTTLLPAALVVAPGDGLFAVGSAVISDTGVRYLTALRGKLDAVKRINCVGFTDSQGTPESNKALGQARAEAVCAFLARNRDVKRSSTSRGENDPRASNLTAAGREQNRRVEIHLEY